MPTSYSCDYCKSQFEVADDKLGRIVQCPNCLRDLLEPAPTSVTVQSALPPVTASADVQAGAPSPRWPESATGDDDLDIRKRSSILQGYKSGSGLATAVKILFGLHLILSTAMVGSSYVQMGLANRLIARVFVAEAELENNDTRQIGLGVAQMGLYWTTALVFLFWIYRAHANLKPLGATSLTYTPGWAAGAWFVPILNLFRPVQITQEIWRNSDPASLSNRGIRFHNSTNSTLVGVWWAMWLISNIVAQIAMRSGLKIDTPESLKAASIAAMAADGATAVAAGLALAVVHVIDARQTASAEVLKEISTAENDE